MENKEVKKALDFLFDEAVTEYEVDEDNSELLCFDCTNDDKYLDPTNKIENYIKQLEQALDKACLKLAKIDKCYKNISDACDDFGITVKQCKECWKEWALQNRK